MNGNSATLSQYIFWAPAIMTEKDRDDKRLSFFGAAGCDSCDGCNGCSACGAGCNGCSGGGCSNCSQ